MRKFQGIILSVLLTAFVLVPFIPCPAQAASEWKVPGSRFKATAGATLVTGDVVCFSKTTGYVYKADADVATLRPAVGIIGKGGSSGSSVEVIVNGILGGQSGKTAGTLCWISDTAGGIKDTEVDAYPQILGEAISASQYQINIQPYDLAIGAATGTSGTFSGTVTANSFVGSAATVSGDTTLASTTIGSMNVSGPATFTGDTTLASTTIGSTTISGPASISGDITAGGGRVAVYCFENNDIASAQSAVAMNRNAGGTVTGIAMPFSGSILAVTVDSNTAITSGSFTGDPTVDGGATGLQGVLNVTDTTTDYAEQAKDTDTFTAGQILGVDYTTTGTFTPVTVDIGVCVTVEY